MNETNETALGPLVEGRDFYMEDGLLVLTAEYLLRRGFCCGNICRHCPYGEAEQKMAQSKNSSNSL